MSDNIIRYYIPKDKIDMLEWESFNRIMNYIFENIKYNQKQGVDYLNVNSLRFFVRLLNNVKNKGLRSYIFDTISSVYNSNARNDLRIMIEKSE